MLKKGLVAVILLLLLIRVTTVLGQENEKDKPRNVILFVSDGCGPASFTMARDFLRYQGTEGLAIDELQVGSIRTYASNSRVTDSAAGATAFACGIKTYNGAIGVDTLQQPVATLLEAAKKQGMATGLVATSTITHATPASFSAHVTSRSMEAEIASQQLTQNIDVMFGGGARFYLPQSRRGLREDERDLLAEAREKGVQVLLSRPDFDGPVNTPVLGLFTMSHMSFEIDRDPSREPSLAEMTQKAINLLKDNTEGFFLMVEGSRIDHAAHANDAAAHLHEVLAFDKAIEAALQFARTDGQTLIVATSDHETGGLTLGRSIDGRGQYTWKPEVLAGVKHSHGRMGTIARADSLLPCPMLEDYAGINCTEGEENEMHSALGDANQLNFLVGEAIAKRAVVGWTTNGHTAVDVNLYAYGPGREHFIGHHDNTKVGTKIADLLGFDLDALTQELRDALELQASE